MLFRWCSREEEVVERGAKGGKGEAKEEMDERSERGLSKRVEGL